MSSKPTQPGWRVVFSTELRRLWLGWRGPLLLLIFSLFLSIYVVLLAINPEINVLSQRKMLDQTVQVTILIGIVTVVLLGADSFSGERDHRSLESLLLTPTPRSQLMFGKLLAILSLWLGMVPIALPYVALVAQGTDVVLPAMLLLILTGSLLVTISGATAVLISALSPANLTSFAVSFGLILLLAAPAQLPGQIKELPALYWFIVSNPLTAVTTYQSNILIEGEPWTAGLNLLISALVALVLLLGLGTRFASQRLSLEGGLQISTTPQQAAGFVGRTHHRRVE